MNSLKVALLVVIFQSAGLQEIDVEPDRNIELECQGPENGKLILLEWKKHDLLSDGYVFFYRDDRPHKNFQDPIFKDRVKLRDPQMNNMDMTIILSNTTINDTGTYECCIIVEDTGDSRRATSVIKHEIRLKVRLPGHTVGATEDGGKKQEAGYSIGFNGLLISLGFSAVGFIVLGFCIMIPKKKINRKKKYHIIPAHPSEEADNPPEVNSL